MGLFDGLGFSRGQKNEVKPPVLQAETKAADLSTGGGAWSSIFGGGNQNNFSQFNNMQQQMAAYNDWVYAAAHTIAEQCAAIDLRVFVNRSKVKSATIGRKMFTDPATIRQLQHEKVIEVTKSGNQLIRKETAALEEIQDDPLLDLLNAPNPFMTGNEFFELTFLHLELTGNAYWAIERDKKGQPSELWPLMPQFIKVVPDKEKFIIGYTYNVNNEEVPFSPDDIIHHKYSNPNDLRMGMSTVQAAARAIDTDSHAADYNRSFFYNSAQPDAVLYTESNLDDKSYKRLVSQWRDTYGGTQNSHRTAILENGLKYAPRVLTQKDMDWLNGRNFNRDQILSIFGVPKSIIGLDESMSRANAETAEYVFVKGKIRPKMLRLTARITEDLAVQFDKKLIVSFTDPVPSDKEFILLEKKAAGGNLAWRTVNENRALEGKDPIPGGDYLYIPTTMMAMAEDPFEPRPEDQPAVIEEDAAHANNDNDAQSEEGEENGGKATGDPATPPTTGTSNSSNDSSGSSSSSKSAEKLKKKDPSNGRDNNRSEPNSDRGHGLHILSAQKDFKTDRDELADTSEVQFLRASRSVFLEQKKEVLNNLKDRFTKSYKPSKRKMTQQQKSNITDLFDPVTNAAAWATAFDPIYRNTVKQMGQTATAYAIQEANAQNDTTLAIPTYDDQTSGVQKFFDQRETKVSESIDDETDKQLKASLAEGIDLGESLGMLADRVENIYGAAAGYRAERIARTESIMSSTFATRDAWKSSGVVEYQKWLTAGDPCPFCADMEGQTLGLNDSEAYFRVGDIMTLDSGDTMKFTYSDIQGPPIHVNCRCSLVPVLFSL